MISVDTLILGAGAAGLFCGARSGQKGQTVLVLDHSKNPAEKVRISGGGRCNFTNIDTNPAAFISRNPHFAKSALARYTPWDFCTLMAEHGLTWHEKTLGQLFCDQKSGAVIKLLLDELERAGGDLRLNAHVDHVAFDGDYFQTSTSIGPIRSKRVVVATGGLSIPKMGASGLAYDIARQFGHDIVPTRPALVPFTFSGSLKDEFANLSGVSVSVEARAESGPGFVENLLFTHRGLSGPAMLQTSSYWQEKTKLAIDLCPGTDIGANLSSAKLTAPKQSLGQWLDQHVPQRLSGVLCGHMNTDKNKRLGEISKTEIEKIAAILKHWALKPTGTEGYRTAEVTAGGVSTKKLSSKTMESQLQPGLFFIGECVDVTGWLGGYNFQWAWASAAAASELA